MLFRKLRNIKSMLFRYRYGRQQDAETSKDTPSTASTENKEKSAEHVNTSSLIQRQLYGRQKQYFDSADYFLHMHEIQIQAVKTVQEEVEVMKQEVKQEIQDSLDIPDNSKKDMANTPLEKAFTEIIDEIKPKEPV